MKKVLVNEKVSSVALDILKKAKDLRIIKVPNFGKLQHLVHARTVEFKALTLKDTLPMSPEIQQDPELRRFMEGLLDAQIPGQYIETWMEQESQRVPSV